MAAAVLIGLFAVALLMYTRTNEKQRSSFEPSSGMGMAEAMLKRHEKAQEKLKAGGRRTRRCSRDSGEGSDDDISYKNATR